MAEVNETKKPVKNRKKTVWLIVAGAVLAVMLLAALALFFALGVWVAEKIQANYKYAQKLHWRQGVLLAEILILFTVGFLPTEYNMLANAMASFACAMQVQSFRKVNGYSYASTMCIGNLRSGTAALSVYFRERKSKQLEQAMYYFGIIFMFALGAGIGGNLSICYGTRMIWVSCGFLMVSFLLMFVEKYKHFNEENGNVHSNVTK